MREKPPAPRGRCIRIVPAVPRSVKNPYTEGSIKRACFEVYRSGGERGMVLRRMLRHGITSNTANIWFGLFGRFVRAALGESK